MTEHYCEEHGIEFTEKTSKSGDVFWSHRKDGGGWCNEAKAKKPTQPQPAAKPEPAKRDSSPEVGMCWNNVGNRIGDGSIDRDYPKSATKIKGQYYKYIFGVTGIKLEKED